MNQKEINEAEWMNRDNWSGSRWASFYFSKRDSRTWVPKSIPWMGWTLNLAKPAGAHWLIFFLAGIPTLVLVILILIIESAP
jgi:uncharacterized membrane protein